MVPTAKLHSMSPLLSFQACYKCNSAQNWDHSAVWELWEFCDNYATCVKRKDYYENSNTFNARETSVYETLLFTIVVQLRLTPFYAWGWLAKLHATGHLTLDSNNTKLCDPRSFRVHKSNRHLMLGQCHPLCHFSQPGTTMGMPDKI